MAASRRRRSRARHRRATSRPPPRRHRRPGSRSVQTPVARSQIAGVGRSAGSWLIGHPSVARDGRPRGGDDGARAVAALPDHLARAGIDDPDGRVRDVAVLGVLEGEQRAVGRERGELARGPVRAGEPEPLGAPRDLLGGRSAERHVDREPVAVADRHGHQPRRLRHALGPPDRHALEERLLTASLQRLAASARSRRRCPPARTPPRRRRRGVALQHADRVVRDLARLAGAESNACTCHTPLSFVS